MNAQREVIYKKRRHALYGERLSLDVANMMYDLTENIVETNLNSGDFENFEIDLISNFAIEAPVTEAEFLQSKPEPLIDKIYHQSYSNYISKSEKIGRQTFPTIENVFKSHSSQYTNIAIPMTDGIKTMNIISNLEKANKSKGKSVMVDTEKIITLKFIDDAWKEQLREMDDLKQSVQNASYEQKDPLLIFKFESFELFKIMINRLNREITSFLVKCDLPENKEPQIQSSMQSAGMDFSKLKTGRSEVGSQSSKQDKFGHDTQEKQVTQPIRVEKKVGRNDPCPCGSGKKYKQCHGLND